MGGFDGACADTLIEVETTKRRVLVMAFPLALLACATGSDEFVQRKTGDFLLSSSFCVEELLDDDDDDGLPC